MLILYPGPYLSPNKLFQEKVNLRSYQGQNKTEQGKGSGDINWDTIKDLGEGLLYRAVTNGEKTLKSDYI